MGYGASVRELTVEYLPGICILVGGSIASRATAPWIPGINELLIAIIIGVVLTNAFSVPGWASKGLRTHKVWLGAGIVLMGSSITIGRIIDSGTIVVLSVLLVSGFTLLFVEILSRTLFGVTDHLASLLAAGTSICGVSAVAAIAGSIDAREDHIAYAAATVLLFDAVTLIGYPIVGRMLDLPAQVFGIWAGLSMFSTGPVVAVGFTHSEIAGQWATITKLTRNTLIGLFAVGYAAYYARKQAIEGDDSANGVRWRELWDRFPKFIIGFLLLAFTASFGLLSSGDVQSIEAAYGWLFLFAFVGLGTDLELEKLRCSGLRPVLVVLVSFVTVSFLSLSALLLLLE